RDVKESYILNCLLVNNCKNHKDLLYQLCKHDWEEMGKYLINEISKEKIPLVVDRVSLVFIRRSLEISHDLVKLFLPYLDAHQKNDVAKSLAKIDKVNQNKELLHELLKQGATTTWMSKDVKEAFNIREQEAV